MTEYRFFYDGSVPSGRIVFRARNQGRLPHELLLLEIPDEFELSVDEQLRSPTRRAFPTRARLPPKAPGDSGVFAVNLEAGRYAVVCFVSDGDGRPHALKGMTSEFRVR